MRSPSITMTALVSTLLFSAPALAQEAPGAPLGEAQPPVGAPPPGASERGVASGHSQARGVEEAPDELRRQDGDSVAPERSEMAKPPIPDSMTSEDEEAE